MSQELNRRELLKKSLLGTAAVAATGLAACSKKETAPTAAAKPAAPAADSTPYVKESDSVAKTLNYKVDASSVSSALRVDKGNTPGAEQFCTNCQFYTAGADGGGKCALFPGKLVKGAAWCKSWSLAAQK